MLNGLTQSSVTFSYVCHQYDYVSTTLNSVKSYKSMIINLEVKKENTIHAETVVTWRAIFHLIEAVPLKPYIHVMSAF